MTTKPKRKRKPGQNAKHLRDFRARQAEKGLCRHCVRKALLGMAVCEVHRKYQREQWRARWERRKKEQ